MNYGEIIAFIATKEGISESSIKDALFELLPEYTIPNIIEIRKSLPKNANGKIDKKSLIN